MVQLQYFECETSNQDFVRIKWSMVNDLFCHFLYKYLCTFWEWPWHTLIFVKCFKETKGWLNGREDKVNMKSTVIAIFSSMTSQRGVCQALYPGSIIIELKWHCAKMFAVTTEGDGSLAWTSWDQVDGSQSCIPTTQTECS